MDDVAVPTQCMLGAELAVAQKYITKEPSASCMTSGAHVLPVLQDGRDGRASAPVTVQVEKSGEVAIGTLWPPFEVEKAV